MMLLIMQLGNPNVKRYKIIKYSQLMGVSPSPLDQELETRQIPYTDRDYRGYKGSRMERRANSKFAMKKKLLPEAVEHLDDNFIKNFAQIEMKIEEDKQHAKASTSK